MLKRGVFSHFSKVTNSYQQRELNDIEAEINAYNRQIARMTTTHYDVNEPS